MLVKYKMEKGWHTFRTKDNAINYGCIADTYEEALKMFLNRYDKFNITII